MASKDKKLQLTLVKSTSGRLKKHKDTIQCLGLRKLHQSVVVNDIPTVRGMINQVSYMLRVEEA